VIGIGAGLDDGIERCPAASPELRGKRIGLDFKLLDGVHVRSQHDATVVLGIVVNAVQQEIIECAARSVGDEAVLPAGARSADIAIRSGSRAHHAGGKCRQLNVVTTIQPEDQ
jgi:hypothetical protein